MKPAYLMEIYNGFQPEKLPFLQWNWRPTANQYAEVSSYLHGRGVHADWPDNIGPLRMALAQSGWHTLSLQMPVLEKSAKYFDYLASLPEAFPRIEAGIKHLLNNGHRPIVLLAYSCGAYMAMARLETSAGKPIDAFIGIGWVRLPIGSPCRDLFRLQHSRSRCLTFMAPTTIRRYTTWPRFARKTSS